MLATFRDIAIIIVAVESIVLLLVLIFVAWQAFRLVRLVKGKSEEFSVLGRSLMESAKHTAETAGETATTVKGSAEFISDTVVSPVVQVVSAVAGARRFVAALFGLSSSRKNGGRT
jgi:K+ transporter